MPVLKTGAEHTHGLQGQTPCCTPLLTKRQMKNLVEYATRHLDETNWNCMCCVRKSTPNSETRRVLRPELGNHMFVEIAVYSEEECNALSA